MKIQARCTGSVKLPGMLALRLPAPPSLLPLALGTSGYAVQLLAQSYLELHAPSDATAAAAAAAVGSSTASAASSQEMSPVVDSVNGRDSQIDRQTDRQIDIIDRRAAPSPTLCPDSNPNPNQVSESGALPAASDATTGAAGEGGAGAFAGDAASAGGAAFIAGDSATAATDGSGAEAVADAGGGDAGA
jgi:hypothetical protein